MAEAMLAGKTVRGAGGTELVLDRWPSRGATRAVILAVHGYGDTGPLTYARAAEAWAARGISVYTYDQRGFGRNDSHGRWPGAQTLSADLVAISRAVRARHPGKPLIVVGHSMGGGIALSAAAEGLEADRLVLAGPAIAGGPEVNPGLRLGGWLLVLAAPDMRFTGEGLVEINPTDNHAELERAWDDAHKIAAPSPRELWGLLRVLDRAYDAAPKVTTPTLVLIGRNDQVVDPNGVIRAARRVPGRIGTKAYPDGWHWLFRDTGAPEVWDDIADFALSRLP
ncbi:alpha/beta fold hydrolase [Oceanibium sediminis]|uniref:alpha/beta fold hydrolase n=1 Tax=Oceanibium sediminis TaxID=2026339 RepID=UPI0018E51D6C|nr:alpha/beta fold hydrolase [Oceanibium sediminis]